jgi:hypothetical protein
MMDLMLNTNVNFKTISPNSFQVSKMLAQNTLPEAKQVAEAFSKLNES